MKFLADQALLTRTKRLVGCERRVNAKVLECLVEINQRQCHLARGFSSLFDYCVHDLGYSNSAAGRRVQAVRVASTLPEVTKKIASGELTLASISQVSSFLYQEKKAGLPARTKQATRELLKTVAFAKDPRETERVLTKVCGFTAPKREQLRATGERTYRLSLNISHELHQKLERLKYCTKQKSGHATYEELLERMVDEYSERHDPELKAKRAIVRKKKKKSSSAAAKSTSSHSRSTKKANDSKVIMHGSTVTVEPRVTLTRYIPAKLRHTIYLRDNGKCTFIDPKSKRRCCSSYKLEFHHKHPFAKGGKHTLKNLTLHCAQHNGYWAKKDFPHRST